MRDETYQDTSEKSEDIWLSSRDTKKILRISDCELMHKRERGELNYKKEGNAFFYNIPVKP